jgi:hypothetical protein
MTLARTLILYYLLGGVARNTSTEQCSRAATEMLLKTKAFDAAAKTGPARDDERAEMSARMRREIENLPPRFSDT